MCLELLEGVGIWAGGGGFESIQQQMERSKNENHGSEYRGNTLKFKCFLTRGNRFLQRY